MSKFKRKPIKKTYDGVDVIDELCRIAFANPDDYFEWRDIEGISLSGDKITLTKVFLKENADITTRHKSAIAGIKETTTGCLELKFHDKIKALESLKKFFGMDNPKDIEKAIKIRRAELDHENKEGTIVNFNFSVVNEDKEPEP